MATNAPAGDPAATAATFCATLVDEWVRAGVRHVVIAPGSRSTPMAIALAARNELDVQVVHDERAAGFVALGMGLATGVPAVVLCTSGTAAAELHAAVVEAHQADVPLLVCTADRPPELRDTGAPQTIDQLTLYGTAVRWFHDPGVPDEGMRGAWRALGARAVIDARGPRPGPVHLNLPFREPLLGKVGELPPSLPGMGSASDGGMPRRRDLLGTRVLGEHDLELLARHLDEHRGVIVAGRDAAGPWQEAVHELAGAVGWPVLADPRSGARTPHPTTVAAFDALLRHEGFAADHTPTVVLHIGASPASKVLAAWLRGSGAFHVHVGSHATWIDPDQTTDLRVVADPGHLAAALRDRLKGAAGTPWLARWRRAESRAQAAIDDVLAQHLTLTEPAVARTVVAAVPEGGSLVMSSSMPVRDVEWYGAPRRSLAVHCNRGANGIDGVTSTAIGVALASRGRTALLTGDIAFAHDSSALVALRHRGADLTIVVVDNDGGGIFSFLPQAQALSRERFELLFGTPHGTDVLALAAAHGLDAEDVTHASALRGALAASGTRVVRVPTDREQNVKVHDELHAAVRAVL
jgi:2-succinyl-5-enolpyruvyl-6-hydroxy-3-cyclohexene-1-carboxylate synthase